MGVVSSIDSKKPRADCSMPAVCLGSFPFTDTVERKGGSHLSIIQHCHNHVTCL